jgi:hypothetical protein
LAGISEVMRSSRIHPHGPAGPPAGSIDTQEFEFVLGAFVAWPDEQGMRYLVSFVDAWAQARPSGTRPKTSIGKHADFAALCHAYAEACALCHDDDVAPARLVAYVNEWAASQNCLRR